jgi:molecular chaperone GrpE (heat shock protein)
MTQLIDKSIVMDKIKKRLDIVQDPFNHDIHTQRVSEIYKDLLSVIDNIETVIETFEDVLKKNNT